MGEIIAPKHVELIEITNKIIVVASSWLVMLYYQFLRFLHLYNFGEMSNFNTFVTYVGHAGHRLFWWGLLLLCVQSVQLCCGSILKLNQGHLLLH